MKDLKHFHKRRRHEEALFYWVTALRSNFPSMSIDKAILNFYEYVEIGEDDWNLRAAKSVYFRMQKEFIETRKTA